MYKTESLEPLTLVYIDLEGNEVVISTEEMLQKAYTESKSRIKIFAVPHKERQLDYQHSTKASETTASDESHK